MNVEEVKKDFNKWFQIQKGDLLIFKKYFHQDIDSFKATYGEQKGWELMDYLLAVISFAENIRALALEMKKDSKFEKFDLDLIIKVTPRGEKK